MKVKIEINSKELDILKTSNILDQSDEKIKFEFEADVITESKKINKEEEILVYGAVLWALLVCLPYSLVKQYIINWNEVIKQLNNKTT